MEISDVILILGSIWSVVGGAYVLFREKSRHDAELEEFRQSKISERRAAQPREWWQEVAVNLSQNPEVIQKLLPMLPDNLVQNLVQQLKK